MYALKKLIEANKNRDENEILNIINKKCDINSTYSNILNDALENPDVNKDYVKFLIEQKINFNYGNIGREHVEKLINKSDILLLLIENGFDINFCISGQVTIFTWIIEYSESIELIKYLLDNGANVNFTTCCCFSPLYTAIRYKKDNVVKLLLDYKADPNNKYDDYLLLSSKKKNSEMFNIFLDISDPFMEKQSCCDSNGAVSFRYMVSNSHKSNLKKILEKYNKIDKKKIGYEDLLEVFLDHRNHRSYICNVKNMSTVLDNCIDMFDVDKLSIKKSEECSIYNGPLFKKKKHCELYETGKKGIHDYAIHKLHNTFLQNLRLCGKDHSLNCIYCKKVLNVYNGYLKKVKNIRKILVINPKRDVSINYYVINTILLINHVNKKYNYKYCILTKDLFVHICRFLFI